MNFKEGIELEANKYKSVSSSSLNIIYREHKPDNENPLLIQWYSDNGEFDYIYDGNKTMFKSIKFKSIFGNVKTPKAVLDLYKKVLKDKEWK